MRPMLIALALSIPLSARGACPERAGQVSADRSLSDAPYADDKGPPCTTAPEPPGFARNEGWTAERDATRMQIARTGTFMVTFGALAMVTGGLFAVCAKNDSDARTRRFCSDAKMPSLITGAASAGLGLGALGISAFVLHEEDRAGHAGLAAGLRLRFALE